MHMFVCVYMDMVLCVWRPEVNIMDLLLSLSLKQSLTEPGVCIMARRTSQGFPGILLSPPSPDLD